MGKLYNIIFNSNNGSGTMSNMTYNIDWGLLPEGKYKCCFSYTSKIMNQSTLNIARVYLDLGQSKNYEYDTFQSTVAMSSRCIGCLDSEVAFDRTTGIGVGSITGTTLTVTDLTSGSFSVGQYISSPTAGITNGAYILLYGAGTYGGTGTYTLSNSSTLVSSPIHGTNPASNYLFADTTTNPPFYLDSRPSNNLVSLSILNELGLVWQDTLYKAPSTYVLTLNMELLD